MPPARLPGRGVLDALHPLVLEDEGPPRRGGVDRVQYEVDAIDVKGSADPFWGLTEAGGSFSRSRLRTLIPYCLYVLYVITRNGFVRSEHTTRDEPTWRIAQLL